MVVTTEEIPAHTPTGFAWERLEDQVRWYERKSAAQKNGYLRLKVLQIVIAAAIPVIAGAGVDVWVAGALGAAIVVLEGFQGLFQFQQNWIRYRATTESLKHEKFLYLSKAGDYARADRPDALLAERVESLVSQEHSSWTATQSEASGRQTG